MAQQPQPDGAASPAAQPGETPEEVVVFGRSLELVGTAEAASEGTISGADLLVRPMVRVAELLEAVPGMVAVQHSGSGKANQYFLRGFNLDHGTDFTTYVDGMPWNLRSHGHGQGYSCWCASDPARTSHSSAARAPTCPSSAPPPAASTRTLGPAPF